MNSDPIKYYILRGSVRGQHPTKFRSVDSAWKAFKDDGKGCAKQGGYSDYRVMAVHKSKNVTGPYYPDSDD
jgi:hypothetical protein